MAGDGDLATEIAIANSFNERPYRWVHWGGTSSRSTCLASACDSAVDDKDPEDDEPPCGNLVGYAQSFLQNPYYFMFASLAKPDDDTDGRTLHDGAS
ncbi:hypothetical protein GGX14DRAFT_555644 [Mycena pura]|uniref:Uncharacterized protein n=1 Tax=Mycena pura TaxID=153505 RepID=A0AAD6YRA1_9AGAR|nr:hypothetical protein GGX14DRAFT_555644 [Mycena pura]